MIYKKSIFSTKSVDNRIYSVKIGLMRLTNKQKSALKAIRASRGRFFGLYTTQGGVMNAQFVDESPNYIWVYDRNNFETRQLAKSSVASVNLG
tara:strand:- start:326 stop:604 length:279 start_codon:yes stop_codon:yes gene_type:complete